MTKNENSLLGELRGCIDPYCAEYKQTTLPQKIQTMRQIHAKEGGLLMAMQDYWHNHKQNGRQDIAEASIDGLANILTHIFTHNLLRE